MSNSNHSYPTINEALPDLCRGLLSNGEEVGSRLGERVMEQTAVSVTLERPWERYITLQARRANVSAQIAETMWVLAGRDDIGWLSHYLPRARDFSDDGRTWRGAYGPRIQRQLEHVITLLQQDQTSRRGVVSIYNPDVDMRGSKDVPCNTQLQFLSRLGKLEMIVTTRSNDLVWGWSGINAFEWSVLQEVVADQLGVRPGPIHFNIGSLHIYDRHWKRARAIQSSLVQVEHEMTHTYFALPPEWTLDGLVSHWFEVEDRVRLEPNLKSTSKAIDEFPESMMRDWLRVLRWWWTGDQQYIAHLRGSDLHEAATLGLQPPERAVNTPGGTADFLDEIDQLHRDKDVAYGDSWCKRGEQIGILANIARKVDRLGAEGGGDTSVDTAVDLLLYVAKYADWHENSGAYATHGTEHCDRVRRILDALATSDGPGRRSAALLESSLRDDFQAIETTIANGADVLARVDLTESMLVTAFEYARAKWGSQ